MKISYCICVWNEHKELDLLLNQLLPNIDLSDEIIIQGDQGKVTDEVISVIRKVLKDKRVSYLEYPLNKDFSRFKNNVLNQAKGDYIFILDPDEYLDQNLLLNLKSIIESNPEIDVFGFPRLNIVSGLTMEYAQSHRWNLSNIQLQTESEVLKKYGITGTLIERVVNFPDPQVRLLKNKKEVRYQNPVHEQFTGFQTYSLIPVFENENGFDLSFCIFHIKDFKRQQNQNNFYSTLT